MSQAEQVYLVDKEAFLSKEHSRGIVVHPDCSYQNNYRQYSLVDGKMLRQLKSPKPIHTLQGKNDFNPSAVGSSKDIKRKALNVTS